MPETKAGIRVMVLHALADCQGAYQTMLEKLVSYVKAGLVQHQAQVRCLQVDFGGLSDDEIRAEAKEAELLIILMSVDFVLDQICMELVDELKLLRTRKGQQQVVLQYRAFSYKDNYPSLAEIARYPDADLSLEEQGTQFSRCLDGFATLLKTMLAGQNPSDRLPRDKESLAQQHATMFKALDRLNYSQQPRKFNQKALYQANSMPSAFLVHGHLQSLGTDWLLDKLMEKLPSQRTLVYRTNVERADFNIDDNGFMSEVAKHLGMPKQADYEQIKDKMLELLKATPINLVLRFDGMKEVLASTILSAFEDFKSKIWEPILKAWQDNQNAFSSRLIIFFVANEPMDHNPNFSDQLNAAPELMVRLPMVEAFDAALLEEWLDDHGNILLQLPFKKPEALLKMDSRGAKINEILTKSRNGYPELVLQHLCKECACDFEQVLKMRNNENGN